MGASLTSLCRERQHRSRCRIVEDPGAVQTRSRRTRTPSSVNFRAKETGDYASIKGSSKIVDQFNVANHVYKDPMPVDTFFDASLVNEVASAGKP